MRSRKFNSISKHRLRGALLVELALGVPLLILIFSIVASVSSRQFEFAAARSEAKLLAEHNVAVRKKITKEGSSIPSGWYYNTNWLRHTSCRGGALASQKYLRCEFPKSTQFGYIFKTRITKSGPTVTATTYYGRTKALDRNRSDLSNIVVEYANGGDANSQTPITQTWFNFASNSTSEVTGLVSNTVSIEEWLRADGSVKPTGNFDWNNKTITNILTAYANQDFRANRDVYARRNISAAGTVSGKYLRASVDVSAPNVYGSNVIATRYLESRGSARVRSTLRVDGDLHAIRNLFTQRVYDRNNTRTYLDSSHTSVLNAVTANSIKTNAIQTKSITFTHYNTEGRSCSLGEIGIDKYGRSMNCVSRRWDRLIEPVFARGVVRHGTFILPISGYTKSQCRLTTSSWRPEQRDGAYKRSRHYGTWWVDFYGGWRVLVAYRAIYSNWLSYVWSGYAEYLMVCKK